MSSAGLGFRVSSASSVEQLSIVNIHPHPFPPRITTSTSRKTIMAVSKNSSESSVRGEKDNTDAHVEVLAAQRKGVDHPAYYEKNGLRTYGDDEDHDIEPPVSISTAALDASLCGHPGADFSQMSFHRIMSLVAMAFLWTGSQIPVYIFGGLWFIT